MKASNLIRYNIARPPRVYWVVFLAAFVFISGCNSCSTLLTAALKEPKVELARVNMRDASFNGSTLVFVIKVQNPNPIDLKVDKLAYRVELNGKMLTDTVTEDSISVEANSVREIEIPMKVEFNQLFDSLQSLLNSGKTDYTVSGKAYMGLFNLPFSKTGEIKLRE